MKKFEVSYEELKDLFENPTSEKINKLRIRCLACSESGADKKEFLTILDKWETQTLH